MTAYVFLEWGQTKNLALLKVEKVTESVQPVDIALVPVYETYAVLSAVSF
jgi:hypothetical protein